MIMDEAHQIANYREGIKGLDGRAKSISREQEVNLPRSLHDGQYIKVIRPVSERLVGTERLHVGPLVQPSGCRREGLLGCIMLD